MNFASETLAERLTRLLRPTLADPEETRSILEKLTADQTPQPFNPPPPKHGQLQLFDPADS